MRQLTGFFFAFILALNLQAQDFDKLSEYVENAMEPYDQVGMAIGILHKNELVYAKGFGERVVGSGTPIDANSVFALASVSKAFTACGIGLLVDEEKLDWDDPVIEHLPGFRLNDPYVTAHMSIRDLLCHRNGYNTFDGDLLWYHTRYSKEEILRRFSKLAPKHGFRSEYGYQNTMFIAAALVIEEISGLTWEEFMEKRILEPLGMEDSYSGFNKFNTGMNMDLNLAMPHVKKKSAPMTGFMNAAGAVGISSSVNDLSKWAEMWVNQGEVDGETFLSKSSWNTITQAHTPMPVRTSEWEQGTHFKAAALGWFTKDLHGVKVLHHSGGLPGYILNFVVIPEKDLAIIVLTNDETILPFAMTNYIQEMYLLNEEPQDWAGKYLPFQENREKRAEEEEAKRLEEKDKKKKPTVSHEEMAGTYTDKMYGDATVEMEGKELIFTMQPTQSMFTGTLEHWTGNTYRVEFIDPFLPAGYVTFYTDSHSKITHLKIDLPNPDFHFYNLEFERE